MNNNIACLIGGKDAQTKASMLMEKYATYTAIAEAPDSELKKIIPASAVKRVKAAVTLPPIVQCGKQIYSSEDAGAYFKPLIGNKDQEELWLMGIAKSRRVLFCEMVYRGAIGQIPIDASIYRLAVRKNVPEVIIAHNHPSGSCDPSPEDITASRTMKQGFKLLGIDMLDSLVVTASGFKSLATRLN